MIVKSKRTRRERGDGMITNKQVMNKWKRVNQVLGDVRHRNIGVKVEDERRDGYEAPEEPQLHLL